MRCAWSGGQSNIWAGQLGEFCRPGSTNGGDPGLGRESVINMVFPQTAPWLAKFAYREISTWSVGLEYHDNKSQARAGGLSGGHTDTLVSCPRKGREVVMPHH